MLSSILGWLDKISIVRICMCLWCVFYSTGMIEILASPRGIELEILFCWNDEDLECST